MLFLRRSLLLAAFGILALVPVGAQYALDVDAVVGFGGVFRAGAWTPIHITVQNLGEDVAGEISVEIERGDRFGPDRYAVRYARAVELVSGSSKAFSFVVPVDTTVYPVRIRVTDGDDLAHEEEYDLLGRSVPAKLALVLARRPNLDFLLPLYNTRERRVLDIVYPLPNYLPEDWQGYEAVDVVVIHDSRLQELSERQVVAIRDWVATGGRLVISGGAHFGPADVQTLTPLGDFTTTGITTTRVEQAGFLETGLPIGPEERDAEVVATEFAGTGTRMELRRLGSGDIVLLPVDYANLVRVAPLTSVALWNSLLSASSSEDPIATETRRRVFETEILANQLSLPLSLYDFPSRLLVLGLAISYVVGVGGILFWLSRGTGRLRRRLGIPGIVALTAVVTFVGQVALTDSLQPAEALALSIERAQLVGDGGYALVSRDTALFSRQLGVYAIRYPGAPILVPMEERDHVIVRSSDETSQSLTVGRWGYENNLAVQIVPLDVFVAVHNGSGYVELGITNDSALRLDGLIVLRDGFPQPIGDLPPGTVLEHVVAQRAETDFQSIDWEQLVPDHPLAANRAQLLGDIARRQRFEQNGTDDLLVVGWTARPLLPAAIEPPFERTVDLHLIVIPIRTTGETS